MSAASHSLQWSTVVEETRWWIQSRGAAWALSVTVHAVIFAVVVATMNMVAQPPTEDAPSFEAAMETLAPDPEITNFKMTDPPLETSPLNTDTLLLAESSASQQLTASETEPGGAEPSGPPAGSSDSFSMLSPGPGPSRGFGPFDGSRDGGRPGGKDVGFATRGKESRGRMLGDGATKDSEQAVAGALNWLARHQLHGGNWSLANFQAGCKDATCTGRGSAGSDAAATAMALLPFLAAGQTHRENGPYRKNIGAGLAWLISNQKPDGDLSAGSSQRMYTHGLTTICLCEAYGLSHDPDVKVAAQRALNFICAAQNPTRGGWWYQGLPDEAGDTSVVGWQIMALKSGIMAGLKVPPAALTGAQKWLQSTAHGKAGGLFAYNTDLGPTPSMTSVGLLCSQYLGMKRSDPAMVEGVGFLMSPAQLPAIERRNIYYWYYATQVLHNVPGPDWDNWNRKMRKLLITTQVKKGCARGSWDPVEPVKDQWGDAGGRIMMTSLSALTLEVYYRYLPLYKLEESPARAAN
jgi:hypothetical protein